MRIAIIGYGKMGREVARIAEQEGVTVSAIIDPSDSSATYKTIGETSLRQADVAIDFSSPKTALSNIEKVAKAGKNMVVGTTGWYDRIEEARRIVQKNKVGLVYSPNFSIGSNVFMKIVEYTSQLMNNVPSYDPYITESHHNQKEDAPSGTARALADTVVKNIKRKKRAVFDRPNGKILPEELHVTSIRAGWIPGTHTVGFDSQADTIELTHRARSRTAFAAGAIYAARWIAKKRGMFSMEDMMQDMLQGR